MPATRKAKFKVGQHVEIVKVGCSCEVCQQDIGQRGVVQKVYCPSTNVDYSIKTAKGKYLRFFEDELASLTTTKRNTQMLFPFMESKNE